MFLGEIMVKKIKFIPHSEQAASVVKDSFVPASRAIPDWWRKTKPTFGSKEVFFEGQTTNFTVKKCVPFLDALSAGYLFILQQDVIVQDHPSNSEMPFLDWKPSPLTPVTDHSAEQIGDFEVSQAYARHVFKWHNEWEINTPKGYGIIFSHPTNRFDLPFRTLTGFVDTDSYQRPTHFPFVLEKTFRGIIKAGTPVAHALPVKRDSWISTYEEFNLQEMERKAFNFSKHIHSAYRNFNWFKKSYK